VANPSKHKASPRGSVLRIKLFPTAKERWCVLMTNAANQRGLHRLGAVILTATSPTNDVCPLIAATGTNGLDANFQWRANVEYVVGIEPDHIIGRRGPISHEELTAIDGAIGLMFGP
jgi:hypothetical protein